jgi:hypothetical protein
MGGNEELTSPSRRRLLDQAPDVIVPETGSAKYFYVDPRAGQGQHEDQGDALMDALKRLLEQSQQYQPKAQEGTFGF